jgi:hypothetical protein
MQIVEGLMQVYISWSGQRSYRFALLIRNLLRKVIPELEVWVSSEDIQDGARWSSDLIEILNQVTFCLICANPSNQLSPWLQYELGAIAMSVDRYAIRVLLHELTSYSIKGPLSLYDSVQVTKNEFQKLFEDLLANFTRIRLPRFDMVANLDQHWPSFQQDFSEIGMVSQVLPDQAIPEEEPAETASAPLEHVNEIGQNIIALISVNEGIDDERIATTMYLNRSDTLRHLIDLENKGLVRSNLNFGIRRWFITERGRKYLPGVYQD